MLVCLPVVLPLALVVSGPGPAGADEPLSRVAISKLGKPATALVEIRIGAQTTIGSAFCVSPTGLFVTNEHVAAAKGRQGGIRLVLNAGEKTQRVLTATVVRTSKEPDLALLRVEGEHQLPALSLGTVDELAELMDLVAFGFPFGNALALSKGEYPSVSVNAGSVTSLRKRNGELHVIQVDIALNPGNSGGPVLDRNGKVVGVVVAGVRGSGVNFVLPVNHVAAFLTKPDLHFTPPALTAANLHAPVLFQARAVALVPSKEPLAVELRLRAGNEPERKHAMELVEGVYRVTTSIVPRPEGPRKLRVAIRYGNGSVSGTVIDQTFTLDGKSHSLSEVRQLAGQTKSQVTLQSGQSLEGTLAGLEAVPVSFGKQEVRFNLGRALDVSVETPATIGTVSCTVVVTQGGKEVARQAETVTVNP